MRQAIQLGLLAFANIGITVLFQWYILTELGASSETDAFFAGITLPQIILVVISSSLMHVLVPLLAGEDLTSLKHDAWGFFILVGGLFGILSIALSSTATYWIPVILPGFSEQGWKLTTVISRIQLISMFFTAINGVQNATYHAQQRFMWVQIAPLLAGIISLSLLTEVLPKYGVIGAAWLDVLRTGLQTVLLLPVMGWPLWPDFKRPSIKTSWRRMKPLLFGTAYYKTDPLVDRYLLSSLNSGSLSLYYLAQQIFGAASLLINKAVAAPLVPHLSRLFKSGDTDGFWQCYHRKLLQIMSVGIIGLLVLFIWGGFFLNLLVGHGNVTQSNVIELWWIMVWLAGMFVGGIAGQICSTTFYSLGDTTTPSKLSIVTYTIYIPCKVVAFYSKGIMGLAVVTSVYCMTNFLFQAYLLRLKKQKMIAVSYSSLK